MAQANLGRVQHQEGITLLSENIKQGVERAPNRSLLYALGLTDEEIQAMADTYTEGYRIGFEVTGKDLGKKQTVQLRYPIGFERMVRAAVHNFEKMNLKPTMLASATSPNKQFDYDQIGRASCRERV